MAVGLFDSHKIMYYFKVESTGVKVECNNRYFDALFDHSSF